MIRRMLQSPRGVTLTELLIVIAIIAVLSVLVVPNFMSTSALKKLKADAMDIARHLKYAKMQAVSSNGDIGVYFYPDREVYCVFMDSNDNGQFDDPIEGGADGVLKHDLELRGGVKFKRSADWTVENNRIIFSPNGSANVAAGTVVVENVRKEVREIIVHPFTGRIRIE